MEGVEEQEESEVEGFICNTSDMCSWFWGFFHMSALESPLHSAHPLTSLPLDILTLPSYDILTPPYLPSISTDMPPKLTATVPGPHTRHTFSYQLHGYDAAIDNRIENQVIRLNSIIATKRYQEVQKAYTAANGPPVVCTEEELNLDMDDETLLTAVVVGVRPSYKRIYGDKDLRKIFQKGKSVQSREPTEILKHDPTALLVVCPRFRDNAVFYALTKRNRDTNQCDAVAISSTEVFFFPEFRDDTQTTYHSREQTWPEKIRAKMGKTVSKPEHVDKIYVLLEKNLSASLASF